MAKSPHPSRNKLSPFLHGNDGCLYICGAIFAFLLFWCLWSYAAPAHYGAGNKFIPRFFTDSTRCAPDLRFDSPDSTFYDDPELRFSIDKKVTGWDEKRKEWLNTHPTFAAGAKDRVVMVTGSQPKPCRNPTGDHLLLRAFKNKVDYCRIHGYDVFYNTVLLHPKMTSYWAKLPVVKAAMLAHPEAEWIWWVDSDAFITDMEYKLPLERYDRKAHNLVVHGWSDLIYGAKSWTSLNAGVFLIRNCQWSMDFIDDWAKMGPISPEFKKWGQIQRSLFKDKMFPESDDQSALVYMIYKNRGLTNKIYLEGEFYFEGYWVDILPTYDNTTEKYTAMERDDAGQLRRRHAEKVSEQYAAFREPYLKNAGIERWSWRRPFITHFTGCQPCNGEHNPAYTAKSCWDGMVKALNFADNQVLRNYGFVHQDLLDSETVTETPFDFPQEGPW